jgi:hypothetical protein
VFNKYVAAEYCDFDKNCENYGALYIYWGKTKFLREYFRKGIFLGFEQFVTKICFCVKTFDNWPFCEGG